MAFSVSTLNHNSAGASSGFTSAAVSAPEGSLLVLWVFVHDDPNYGECSVASVSGTGLTWTRANQIADHSISLEAWVASVPAGGISSETITVAFDNPSHGYVYDLDLVRGAAYFSPLVTGNSKTSEGVTSLTEGSPSSLTFAAAASTENRFLYCCAVTPTVTGYTQSATDGYTVLTNVAVAPYYSMSLHTQVSPDSTSVNASSSWYDPGAGDWWALGLELSYCGC